MRSCSHPSATLSSFLLLLPTLTSSLSINCDHIRENDKDFNFKELDGPHSLYTIHKHSQGIRNTTFTFNICRPLRKSSEKEKNEDCPNNSRVCAIETFKDSSEDEPHITDVVPIAGEFSTSIGGALDPKWTRLKDSPSHADREKEGLRLEMNGGKYEKKAQKAYFEFLCIPKEDEEKEEGRLLAREDEEDDDNDKSGQEVSDGNGGRIKFLSWDDEQDSKAKVLRMEWHTKHACEDAVDGGSKSSSGHWGFFTWLILIVFMGVAAYLIFGSWLNYNRYSARGWDLVPHSDTIRDIPYLLKDWIRRVIDTVQGGGSRGGYSAV